MYFEKFKKMNAMKMMLAADIRYLPSLINTLKNHYSYIKQGVFVIQDKMKKLFSDSVFSSFKSTEEESCLPYHPPHLLTIFSMSVFIWGGDVVKIIEHSKTLLIINNNKQIVVNF